MTFAHEHADTGKPNQQSHSEPRGELLRAQDEDFENRHEGGDCRHHDSCDS
jgi:hypothetical protein